MSKSFRFGSAISLVALATALAGCSTFRAGSRAAAAPSVPAKAELGAATRALAAMNSGDVQAAIGFAESAVEKTPGDASLRALLGNAYFAAGRFASAEAAYKDSLSISSSQPQLVLKLALTQIAQGKNGEALSYLEAGREALEPADYGLALALAGRPGDAVQVLEAAARSRFSDVRVRQNLALALALTGDWTNARAVAAQDVPADQLDSRIQQWMQLANPTRASDQVATLIGVTPAPVDAGQPTRLALRGPSSNQQAQAAPAPAPQAVVQAAAASEALAFAAPPPPPPFVTAPEHAPEPEFVEVRPRASAPAESPAPAAAPAAAVAEAPAPAPEPSTFAAVAAAVPQVRAALAALKPLKPIRAKAKAAPAPVRKASAPLRRGNSNAVVQLGAYASPKWVASAWSGIARRHGVLRGYQPMSARFTDSRGTFYRLSVKGFASDRDARLVCESLKRVGTSCFVRNVAGDAPVRLASR